MIRRSIVVLGFLFTVAVIGFAGGEKGIVEGVISGAHCGVNGMACPTTHDLKRSEVPGIFANDNTFYFITNVPQSFIAQWAFKEVSVEGKIYTTARAVDASKISVKENGRWHAVYEDGNITDPMGHPVKLGDAVEIDGKWYCGKCAAIMKQ